MIDLARVRVLGSSANCLMFPQTARLTHFGAWQQGIEIHTTGTDTWPAISIEGKSGPEDDQAGTLWVFIRPEGPTGAWYATGAERLRPGQLNGVKPQGDPTVPDTLATLIGNGWLYDANRWGPMAGYNPQPGEPVGVMVVAGSTRSDDRTPLQARTQVRVIAWPAKPGLNPCQVLWDEGQTQPAPTPVIPPQPPTPQPTSPEPWRAELKVLRVELETLRRQSEMGLLRLTDSTQDIMRRIEALTLRLDALVEQRATTPPTLSPLPATVRIYGIRVPVTWG